MRCSLHGPLGPSRIRWTIVRGEVVKNCKLCLDNYKNYLGGNPREVYRTKKEAETELAIQKLLRDDP